MVLNVREHVERLEFSTLLVVMWKSYNPWENKLAVSYHVKHLPYDQQPDS